MSTTLENIARAVPDRQPAWEIALLFPDQGTWSEDEYLDLPGNHLVEFTDGHLEVLPMPTPYHQAIADNVHRHLRDCVKAKKLGTVFFAPVPVKVGPAKYREPDVVFVSSAKLPADIKTVKRLDQADLVVEVISDGPENRERDLFQKRRVYAAAGIPEYWIVDPERSEITVLTLQNGEYAEFGVFGLGDELRSALLVDLSMSVTDVFALD